MATPHVSAAFALAIARWGKIDKLSLVRQILSSTDSSWTYTTGFGLLNLLNVVSREPTLPPDNYEPNDF